MEAKVCTDPSSPGQLHAERAAAATPPTVSSAPEIWQAPGGAGIVDASINAKLRNAGNWTAQLYAIQPGGYPIVFGTAPHERTVQELQPLLGGRGPRRRDQGRRPAQVLQRQRLRPQHAGRRHDQARRRAADGSRLLPARRLGLGPADRRVPLAPRCRAGDGLGRRLRGGDREAPRPHRRLARGRRSAPATARGTAGRLPSRCSHAEAARGRASTSTRARSAPGPTRSSSAPATTVAPRATSAAPAPTRSRSTTPSPSSLAN